MRTWFPLWLIASLCGQSKPTALPPGDDLLRVLALPNAAARRVAADTLAARADVSLQQWLIYCQAPPLRKAHEAGPGRVTVDLPLAKTTEATEIHFYVPKAYDPSRTHGLLLAAHGTGGSGAGQDQPWRAIADQLGLVILAPSEAGPNEGYAFSDRERESALAALRWARARFAIDPNRIYLSGVSRGGHIAWDLALRWPDLPAAIAPFIGGPRLNIAAGQNNLRWIENLVTMPIRDLQGAKDDPRLLFNLELAFAKLTQLKAANAQLQLFPELGHSFEFSAVDWPEFLRAAQRDPLPMRVVRVASRLDQARAFWLEILAFDRGVEDVFTPKLKQSEFAAFDKLDDEGKRRFLQDEAEKRNARAEASMTAPGQFTIQSNKVTKLCLLLSASMFVPGKPVQVQWNGKSYARPALPGSRVLLRDFVERQDPSFLPVAEVILP